MSRNQSAGQMNRILKMLVSGLKHLFLHNGWVKLLAVLISLVLWAGLISQDESITREKNFQNINVTVSGTDTMKRNGYIVTSNLDELLSSVSATAAVPQKQYSTAEASVYNVRVDLSKINGTGEQELKLLSNASATYGRITSLSPSSVTVQVEEYSVRQRIPVSLTMTGDVPEGWYNTKPTVDPDLIAVSGPRTLVQSISRAKVFVDTSDLEWKENTNWTTAEIHLYNRAGEEVSNSLLTISSESLTIDSVLIDTTIMPKQYFDTRDSVQINGSPADGYAVTDIRVSPETISIAARSEVLNQMDGLPLDRTVNIAGLTETGVFQLKVQKPSDDAVLSNDTVTVTVEISPAEERR